VTDAPLHVVTGAFGYTGRYIARELLASGARVRTLTNSLDRGNPFGDAIEVHPINFDDPAALVESLRGAYAFHNTYWVRYDHKRGSTDFGYTTAVENSRVLFDCAATAGVQRVVHISVANASEESDWGCEFRGSLHHSRPESLSSRWRSEPAIGFDYFVSGTSSSRPLIDRHRQTDTPRCCNGPLNPHTNVSAQQSDTTMTPTSARSAFGFEFAQVCPVVWDDSV
jgi:hypothetical protein